MHKLSLLSALALGATLVGCASNRVEDLPSAAEADTGLVAGSAVGAGSGSGAVLDGSETGALAGDELSQSLDGYGGGPSFGSNVYFEREAIFDPGSPLSQRVFYFAYDQDTLEDQYLDAITDHGRYLATYPDVVVRLEGHADERGTREYNIALAERRAQAVKRLMMLQGASYNQVITISYGEEQPAVLGTTEQAFARNRRVELIYE